MSSTKATLLLKRRMHSVASSASTEQPTSSTEVGDNSAPAPATDQQDFFAVLAARRQQDSTGAGSDVNEELSKYLSDKSTDVTALKLNCYPLIRKLYIELNTGLPANTDCFRCNLSLAMNTLRRCCSCVPLNCELLQLRNCLH